jgi:uncharacterized protein YjbI with pentapeptide repeats
LCCVAPAFSASADFAIDKDAGRPCPNLQADYRCAIHARLRQRGFPGCAAYDCFGAGQKVSRMTFGGQDWRYLTEGLTLQAARPLHGELRLALDETERLTRDSPESLLELDVAAHRRGVSALLLRASELARAGARRHEQDREGADLIGADLRDADLRGASLRGAYLIGADLRGADLSVADLLGTDFRGADLSRADLSDSIFLTQSQLDAAKGDAGTTLPPSLTRPAHWSRPGASRRGRRERFEADR